MNRAPRGDIQSVFYQADTPRSYLGWGQSSQLGFSLGLAMGAKIANPDKLVVNVMGDASVGMTGMDWETAVRENIPILTVIKHDSIFSGYDRHIPVAIERYKISTQTGDYANVARALGCHAEKVETVQGSAAGPEAGNPGHEGRPAGRRRRGSPPRPASSPRFTEAGSSSPILTSPCGWIVCNHSEPY